MSIRQATNDWQVAGIAQVGGAMKAGGGLWWYQFRSPSLDFEEMFMFVGVGMGVGGSIGGGSIPDLENMQLAYSPVECLTAFSVADLDMCLGRVTTAGASLAVGWGISYISAYMPSGLIRGRGTLFEASPCSGFTAGVGTIAITTVGVWRSATLAAIAGRRAADPRTRTSRVPNRF